MEVYFGVAEEMGISEEEMAAVRAMVMAVSAGRIYFQSKSLVEKMDSGATGEEADPGCTPGCCE